MSPLKDSNNTGESNSSANVQLDVVFGDIFLLNRGQTINFGQTYIISSVKVLLSRIFHHIIDTRPGNIKVSIYATTENGSPTGSILGSGTINGNSIPFLDEDSPDREWREFAINPTLELVGGTKYAIVLSIASGPVAAPNGRVIQWWKTGSGNKYPAGAPLNAGNVLYPGPPDEDDWGGEVGGSSDHMFETYGLVAGESDPSPFPVDRPSIYDPDDYWDPDSDGGGDWTSDPADLLTLGGGRYNQQLVVLSNQGKIYFRGL